MTGRAPFRLNLGLVSDHEAGGPGPPTPQGL